MEIFLLRGEPQRRLWRRAPARPAALRPARGTACCYRATQSTTLDFFLFLLGFVCAFFWSKPVGQFCKRAHLVLHLPWPFLFGASQTVWMSMPLLCICGAKFPFASVFTVGTVVTGQDIPLLNHCIETLSPPPPFPVCHVYSFDLL